MSEYAAAETAVIEQITQRAERWASLTRRNVRAWDPARRASRRPALDAARARGLAELSLLEIATRTAA